MNTATKHPPKPSSTPSGRHPAVREFRRKLDSIGKHQGDDLDALNADLEKFLEDVKSDPPPKPE